MSLRSRNRASTFYLALAISFGAAVAFSACASGVPDELLQERVEAALAAASDVPADALSVVVMDGIVTISGSVVCQECGGRRTPGGSGTVQQSLGAVVRAIPGVESVEFELEYEPSPGGGRQREIRTVTCTPDVIKIGGKVRIEVDPANTSDEETGALIDLRVYFVKANCLTNPKVFKGAELTLKARDVATVGKSVSLAQHSTRKHYPGTHRVEVMLNGVSHPGDEVELV